MVLARIAALIAREATPASIYTMFDAGKPTASPVDEWIRVTSPLSHLPGGIPLRRWLLPLYPWAVGHLSRRLTSDHARAPINLLISTSSAAIKGLHTPRRPSGEPAPHLCYCHSPARYVWSDAVQSEYTSGGTLSSLALRLYAPSFKRWDRRTASNVTHFIANSSHTAALIRAAYDRDSTVIHPPVRTTFFTPDPSTPRTDSWLVVSALEPYKRVDLAIRAASLARHRLTIAGDGSMRTSLESLARDTAPGLVTFEGRVTDDRLRTLYRTARLLLFPQIEDFGIIACEALACGTPIVARNAGGALDILTNPHAAPVTGSLFTDPTPEALVQAANCCPDPTPSIIAACVASAARFAESRFDDAMREQILTQLRAPLP
jgi:glycosyltransferase involved in cell wall biosynthesis